ncbi:DUF5710 domain-containing protein [Variovorax sp. J22R115]|uniref:DUF5710 domain-containing protein n=1 Tax=Variovorax sp. J22R115 TaxID=3053509 RepID=UPI0034DED9D1
MEERHYLNVPFKEKDAAKALGARYDSRESMLVGPSWGGPGGLRAVGPSAGDVKTAQTRFHRAPSRCSFCTQSQPSKGDKSWRPRSIRLAVSLRCSSSSRCQV